MKRAIMKHGRLLEVASFSPRMANFSSAFSSTVKLRCLNADRNDLIQEHCKSCQAKRPVLNIGGGSHHTRQGFITGFLVRDVSDINTLKHRRDIGEQQRKFHSNLSQAYFPKSTGISLYQGAGILKADVGRHFRCYSTSSNDVEDVAPVSSADIKTFLNKNEISFKQGHTCFNMTCPRVVRRRMKLTDIDKLYLNMTTGYFVCLTCKRCGSWSQFQDNVHNILQSIKKKRKLQQCLDGVEMDEGKEVERARELWAQSQPLEEITQERLDYLQHVFNIQELNLKTLSKFQVQVLPDSDTLLLPIFTIDGAVQGVKVMTYKSSENEQSMKGRVTTRTIPRIDYQGFFGWNTMTPGCSEVILVASEFDAMAVHQATHCTALALPKGISTLPQKVLPLVEQCSSLKLWLGDTMLSWEAAKQFSRKLNDARCSLIRPGDTQPTPLAALRSGLDLSLILNASRRVIHKSIITFKQLRQEVFSEISQMEQIAGIKWKKFPVLTGILKGHRRGELTVFTGPTGSGKTTFISEYSLDLCEQGVTTLWGSFEINNARLVRTMLTQYSQMNLSKHLDKFEEWANRFELLPMYFMTFHGEENIKKVIETMSHAVYIHDISHVVVDNLQFMMGSTSMVAPDKYGKQDLIIAAFRKFATQMNCHVTLVIHPRKERDTDELTLSSIFGSAKATQEADNVLILQDRRLTTLRSRKYLQIAKNRFDGDQGVMLMKFDKNTLSFAPKPKLDSDKKPRPVRNKPVTDEADADNPDSNLPNTPYIGT